MGSSNYYQNFIADILHLYSRTGIKRIENDLLRVSQSYDSSFYKWLLSNRQIASKLNYPEVFLALSFLVEIRKNYPPPVGISDIAKIFIDAKESKYLPYIISFNQFLEDPAINAILFPFKDILVACSGLKIIQGEEIDVDGIGKDLSYIKESFDQYISRGKIDAEDSAVIINKETVKQKKTRMFSYLLQKFSNEIASAADRSGFSEFASKLRGGILANPSEIENFTGMKIEPEDVNEAKRMVKYVSPNYNITKADWNYNFIKERSMLFTSKISKEQLMQLYRRRVDKRDYSRFMDSPTVKYPNAPENIEQEVESISTSDADLLSPEFLTLLCVFFVMLYDKNIA